MQKYLHNASDLDLRRGYTFQAAPTRFACLSCNTSYEQGLIHRDGEALCDAERAVRRHVEREHGGPLRALLSLEREHHGLTDIQRQVVALSYGGHSDKEIAAELGGRSASTIRNHRFQLRRRAREARVFLAIMELLEIRGDGSQSFIDFHPSIPVDDERIVTTTDEAEALLDKYFVDRGRSRLIRFPKKEKHKLVILRQLAGLFAVDRAYSEREVNEVLGAVYDDHVTLRRYLIEYRFLDRRRDGSAYWRTDGELTQASV
jgi:DNA-binding CsgD family transcriptional regulator